MPKWTEKHSLMASNCWSSSQYPVEKEKEGAEDHHPKTISASIAIREVIGRTNADQGGEDLGAEVSRMIGDDIRDRDLPDQGTTDQEVGVIREIEEEEAATLVEIVT